MEEKYKIHGFYIFSILISIIIVLLAVKWTKIPDLVDYIAFALTLSSLILAVLAIVYSMVSNESLGKVMQNLHISSNNLKDTSKEINESNRVLLQEIKLIPAAIESVDSNVRSTKDMLEGIALPKERAIPQGEIEPTGSLSKEFVEAFLNNSSISGLDAIYAAVLSYKTKTAFELAGIAEMLGNSSKANYFLSYQVAAKAMGLIQIDYDGKHRTIVTGVHETLAEKTEEILAKTLHETAVDGLPSWKENHSSEDVQNEIERWFDSTNKIREYFGISKKLQSQYLNSNVL